MSTAAPGTDPREALRADCSRCVGLCCVATAFSRSADFAFDKAAGEPCPELAPGFACGIHDRLRERGMPGCTAFDCFGAGQHVASVTHDGADWRTDPGLAARMFGVFGVQRDLHEMLWHLAEAEALTAGGPGGHLRDDVADLQDRVSDAAGRDADGVMRVDTAALHAEVGALLGRVSAAVRTDPGPDHTGRDLLGADLRRTDLRRASLRGALLVGADLRGVDLTRADLLGADLRGADVRGARLADALFLTVPQLEAAVGDTATTLPTALARPTRWATAPTGERPPADRPARRRRRR